MDTLKDIYLAVWWTISAWPKRLKKRLSGVGEAVRDLLPKVINELVSQSWTVFGLLVGWVVLPDGDTRNFVGFVLLSLCVIWLVTMPLRISRED